MSQDRKQPRVFVVDDEPTISSTLAIILQGFDSRSFNAPLEALQAARSDVPDLLITDLAMPGMSGIELAVEFRRNYPSSKILLFSGTAYIDEFLGKVAADGHTFDLLSKPAHPANCSEPYAICSRSCRHRLDLPVICCR